MNNTIKEIKEKVAPILQSYGVNRASVFGSIARGEQTPASDIDMAVEIKADLGLFQFVQLKHQLEEALNKKVDLVEYSVIKPMLKDKILKEQIVIYG